MERYECQMPADCLICKPEYISENCFYKLKALSCPQLIGFVPNTNQTRIAALEHFLHNQTISKCESFSLYLSDKIVCKHFPRNCSLGLEHCDITSQWSPAFGRLWQFRNIIGSIDVLVMLQLIMKLLVNMGRCSHARHGKTKFWLAYRFMYFYVHWVFCITTTLPWGIQDSHDAFGWTSPTFSTFGV